jgi:hypothetical protein
MDHKIPTSELRFATLKNEATRQRWELFHRAIALAKQSNADAMQAADKLQQTSLDASEPVPQRAEPLLSIAR